MKFVALLLSILLFCSVADARPRHRVAKRKGRAARRVFVARDACPPPVFITLPDHNVVIEWSEIQKAEQMITEWLEKQPPMNNEASKKLRDAIELFYWKGRSASH
jgi:hypothetical protein